MSFPIQQGLFNYGLTDHYAILGVPLDANGQQIRQRYLKIAYLLHPDTCKAVGETEKRKANKILSRLVNPAYEELSRESSRLEYLLVLSQMGKTLAVDMGKVTLVNDDARKLAQAKNNVDLVYYKLLRPLIAEQYQDLEQVFQKTAQISELNLVYLLVKQGQGIQVKSSPVSSEKVTTTDSQTQSETPASPIENAIRRSQDYLNKNNLGQAIAQLREALKIDPKNSSCHGLLGLAYLRQNQVPMAKVHINQAWKYNPHDPIALEAKQELDKKLPPESKSKPSSGKSGSSGIFGGLFGGKKK